jgi:quercetin dioxygenase-like cupin family protein
MQRDLTALFLATLFAATPSLAEQITLIDASKFAWESTPEGVAFAPLQGDRLEESYQAMVRLPAGIISPPHVKSANMFGIMLQGEMIHYANGEDPEVAQIIGAGSFYKIPKGLAHVSACVSSTPCVAYLYQDDAFDFVRVQQ